MRKILGLLTVALFLLAGIASLQAQEPRGKKGKRHGSVKVEKTPAVRAEAITTNLTETLKLDAEQSEKVGAIYLNFFTEQQPCVDENKKEGKPSKGKKGKYEGNKHADPEKAKKRKALVEELSGVLTAEQMTQYRAEMKKMKLERENKQKGTKGKKV